MGVGPGWGGGSATDEILGVISMPQRMQAQSVSREVLGITALVGARRFAGDGTGAACDGRGAPSSAVQLAGSTARISRSFPVGCA
jgi:hypothetical protein